MMVIIKRFIVLFYHRPSDYRGHAFISNSAIDHGLALYGQNKRRGLTIHYLCRLPDTLR